MFSVKPDRPVDPLDIIPFRGVEQPLHSIAWPPDSDIVMNVTGYAEALATALDVQVEGDLVVPVISLPGLALLKLFAWADRGHYDSKDAGDLLLLMRCYADAGNTGRLYAEEAIDILVAVEYDMVLAGPRLLGRDVRAMAAAAARTQIQNLISDAAKMEKLITHIAASPTLRGSDDPIEFAERLLEQFRIGLSGR